MGKLFMLATLLVIAGIAVAQDLGNQALPKVPGTYPVNIPNPERQGGDTVADATVIPGIPFNDSGTTVGYVDDYSSTCYLDDGAPDVVYSLVAPAGMAGIVVQLCGSTYDTGLQVLDASLVEIVCNDDFCGLQSKIELVPVTPGQTYYIVVDGYSSASGSYILDVTPPPPPCIVACPPFACEEGEPPLGPDYVDIWNGGCNSPGGYRFEHVPGGMGGSHIPVGTATLCGVSGWYLSAGSNYRDTDWFTLIVGPGGSIGVAADAEYASYIFELGGTCEGGVTVVQQAIAGPCLEATMTIAGAPFSTKWFWVGPTVFAAPGADTSYDYVAWFSGLASTIGGDCSGVADEPTSWGTVKALYR